MQKNPFCVERGGVSEYVFMQIEPHRIQRLVASRQSARTISQIELHRIQRLAASRQSACVATHNAQKECLDMQAHQALFIMRYSICLVAITQ